MVKQYELPESFRGQTMMIQKLGRLQGLLDAVVECAMPINIEVDPEEYKFADWCLTRAMDLARQIMDETEVKNKGKELDNA